jgi:hypothetical protein
MRLFAPSPSNPAWFYCTRCGFSGDLLDYVNKIENLPPTAGWAIVHTRRSDYQPAKAYMQQRASRHYGEQVWQNIRKSFETSQETLSMSHARDFLSVRHEVWEEAFRTSLYPGKSQRSKWAPAGAVTAAPGVEVDPLYKRMSHRFHARGLHNALIVRIEQKPGQLVGLAYMLKDKNMWQWRMRWLPNVRHYGFCFLSALFDYKARAERYPKLLCLDLLMSVHYIARHSTELGVPPRLATLLVSDKKQFDRDAGRVRDLINLTNRLEPDSTIVFGNQPPVTVATAKQLGQRCSLHMPDFKLSTLDMPIGVMQAELLAATVDPTRDHLPTPDLDPQSFEADPASSPGSPPA